VVLLTASVFGTLQARRCVSRDSNQQTRCMPQQSVQAYNREKGVSCCHLPFMAEFTMCCPIAISNLTTAHKSRKEQDRATEVKHNIGEQSDLEMLLHRYEGARRVIQRTLTGPIKHINILWRGNETRCWPITLHLGGLTTYETYDHKK
jgi:hypothetical protein